MARFDIEPDFEQAIQHHESGQLAEAQALYLRILEIDPAHADSVHLLGLIEYQAGQNSIAADLIRRAIMLSPENAPYHNNLGNALRDLGHLQEAADAFQEALRLRPSSPEINSNLGNALRDLGRPLEALEVYRAAVELRPDLPHPQYNLANIKAEIGDLAGAVEGYHAALALDSDFADAYYNLGNALISLNRLSEAETSFRAVLRLRPGDAGACNNLGIALQEQGRPEEAERCYRDALHLDPDYAEAHYNLGCVLLAHSDLEAATACYERATELKPNYGAAHIAQCMSQLPVIYRDEAEILQRRAAYQASLTALVENPDLPPSAMAEQIGTSQPFFLAYQGYNDRALQKLYGGWACEIMAEAYPPVPLPSPPIAGEKIRIGIVSGFFHDHTVWKLFLKGWLKHIDRCRFEVFCYYTGTKLDADTGIARAFADRFIQASQSGAFWRQAIQSDAPHVLLYPDIGMNPMSARLAAQRLAPVQCGTWGHPETSGFPTIDYFLSNALMEPPDGAEHYTEKLILLPNLSTCFEPDDRQPLDVGRAAFGYRASATVYWSGQALYKYLPQFDAIYPRIALEVPESQFVFIDFAKSQAVTAVFKERLRRAFDRHGLDAERHCVFLPPLDQDHFIAAMGASDIVLDTIGWSGGRSTLDCLVYDPAIVTHAGRLMRGRHTAAILKRMGITDTTATTIDDYVAIAVKLAADEPWRRSIRNQVRTRKCDVYNDLAYIFGLEDFLTTAVQRGRHRPLVARWRSKLIQGAVAHDLRALLNMLRRLYDRLLAECDKPGAIWLLAGVAFAESSFFPIPPDVMLIPMMLANRRRVWWFATVATVSSVIGGFLGYAIGYWLFETVGRFLIEHFWTLPGFERAKAQFDIWGFWLIIGKGVTPIPYKIVTILCGVLHYDLAKFALASVIARGLRFYLEAIVLFFFGEPARAFVEKRLAMTMTAAAVLLVGGFVALHYL